MSVTILESLENADYNLQTNAAIGHAVAKNQLHNAYILLDKGYGLDVEVDPLLDKFGDVENVPNINF